MKRVVPFFFGSVEEILQIGLGCSTKFVVMIVSGCRFQVVFVSSGMFCCWKSF